MRPEETMNFNRPPNPELTLGAKRLDYFGDYIFSRLSKQKAKIEKETGEKVLDFGAGNPDFPPSEKLIDKLSEFIHEKDAHYYPGYKAIPEFRDGIIHWYEKRFSVHLEENELMPLLGAKNAIAYLPLAFLNQGDEVLRPDPGYQGYDGPILIADGNVALYNLNEANNFKINFNSLKRSITPKTRFIYFNAPSNPTAATTDINEMKQLVDLVNSVNQQKKTREKKLFIVSDFAYADITFDNYQAPSILEIPGAKKVAIELQSMSKTCSLAGYRIGYAVGNSEILARLSQIKNQYDSGLTKPLQKMAAHALTNFDKDWQKKMISEYQSRSQKIKKYFEKIELTGKEPKASLYRWLKIPDNFKNSEDFAQKLLNEKRILVTPGTAFGKSSACQNHVRVSICVDISKIDNYDWNL
ncbi:MAG: aminotransferase class I/II-fold pyridoxal phosphate-dependent enzyme [Candidatus Moranbacteria bacterium]|nr:aminotransferase class I/II-fold pyridoxal phosphate-dependent enzyme [Candidatus Moranbacteria bacterium]